MAETEDRSIVARFADLSDPRAPLGIRHSREAILTIALGAVLCGADTWVEMAAFGLARRAWCATVREWAHGIPSHDTFGRVCAALDPEECARCLRRWTQGIAQALDTQVVALEGKALRRAHEAGCRPLQVGSAWASAARLVLAQRAVPEKANAVSALPLVLAMVALDGCSVTIDALGTPAAIAHASVDTGADDVRALTGTQGRREEDVHALFAAAAEVTYAGVAHR